MNESPPNAEALGYSRWSLRDRGKAPAALRWARENLVAWVLVPAKLQYLSMTYFVPPRLAKNAKIPA